MKKELILNSLEIEDWYEEVISKMRLGLTIGMCFNIALGRDSDIFLNEKKEELSAEAFVSEYEPIVRKKFLTLADTNLYNFRATKIEHNEISEETILKNAIEYVIMSLIRTYSIGQVFA